MNIKAAYQSLSDRMRDWPGRRRALLAFIAGMIMVPAMPPWTIWPMLAAGFLLFYPILATARGKLAAFGFGWLFGFGYFLPGLSWIANALLVEGNDFVWVWPLAIAGLPAGLALFTATAALIAWRFFDLRRLSGLFAFAAILALSEWLRGHLFTGFPWNLHAYTWAGWLEMAQSVALIGSYGVNFLTIMLMLVPVALLYCPLNRKSIFAIIAAAALGFSGLYAYGTARLAANPTAFDHDIALRVVQPSIPQEYKWDPDKAGENLRRLFDTSLPPAEGLQTDAETVLIVWPETALDGYMLEHENVRAALRDTLARYNGRALLATGLLRAEGTPENYRAYNSIAFFDDTLTLHAIYDKAHLVPFGEYIPLNDYIPIAPFVGFYGFETGPGPQTVSVPHRPDLLFSPLICYEVIFPGAVTDRQADRPRLMINVTNDAWYGDSAGPRQHLVKARFRAIEEGIPLARSANNGISAVIDAYGRIIWQAPLNSIEASDTAMPLGTPDMTLFTRFRDLPFLAFVFVTLAISMALHKLHRNSNRN